MDRDELLGRIRLHLKDGGNIWTDEILSNMIDQAVEEYSFDTRMYKGEFDIICDSDGGFSLPEDYVGFLCGWNENDLGLTISHSSELSDIYGDISFPGVAGFVYEDTDSAGRMKLCPNPSERQTISVISLLGYGISNEDGYGINNLCYGIPMEKKSYNWLGDVIYIRRAELEEIMDYMAIVYNVCARAYAMDSDYYDADTAATYKTQYSRRVAFLRQKITSGTTRKTVPSYY